MPQDIQKIEYFDASTSAGAIVCYRTPVPLFIEKNGPHATIFKIENERTVKRDEPIQIPAYLVDIRFKIWPGTKSMKDGCGTYYRIPEECHAKRISMAPGKSEIVKIGDQNYTVEDGDYIVTKKSGLNEFCKNAEFHQKFITSMDKLNEHNNSFNSISLS